MKTCSRVSKAYQKLAIALLSAAAFGNIGRGDTPAPEYSYVATSWSGMCYFIMIQPSSLDGSQVDAGSKGCGIAYRLLSDGASKELWRTAGWYSPWVFLSEDGHYLVRMGAWHEGQELSQKDLAVAFYRDGVLLKEFSTADLVKDQTKIVKSVSHYKWLAVDVERSHRIFGEAKISEVVKPALSLDGTFRLETCDGIIYTFDATTGEIRNQKKGGA